LIVINEVVWYEFHHSTKLVYPLEVLVCVWGGVTNKKNQKGRWMEWHAAIWKARNDRIFNNITKGVEDLVEEIKVLSWRWMLGRMKISVCMFSEWEWNPSDCLFWEAGRCCGLDLFSCR